MWCCIELRHVRSHVTDWLTGRLQRDVKPVALPDVSSTFEATKVFSCNLRDLDVQIPG
jgi:hypothetical protein